MAICKKITLGFVLAFICTGLVFSTSVFAASCSGVDTALLDCEEGGTGGIRHILLLILDIMTVGVGVLAVFGIAWMGTIYLTAGDDASRVTKAKHRLLEIIVGVACYAAIYGLVGWFLPGETTSSGGDATKVSNLSISYSGKTYVDETFVPTVTFNEDAADKTYSLKSGATNIVKTSGRGAKCVNTGKATIEAVSSNGKKASMAVDCQEAPAVATADNSSNNSNNNNSGSLYADGTTGSMVDTKLKGKPNIRKETQEIINDHRLDFNVNNYDSKIKKYGGYKKYVKSLGGVFAKYAGVDKIKVKTAADFQEAAEYVWGLMTIWGGDYSGMSYTAWRNNEPWKDGKSDRFRIGWDSYLRQWGDRRASINEKLKNKSASFVCSTFLGVFISSTTLKFHNPENDDGHRDPLLEKYGKIKRADKLQVGDIIYFSSGAHVAIVGEVYKDYVIIYDGGSRFPKHGSYKFKLNRTKSQADSLKGSSYSYDTWWVATRPWKIDQSVTLKGIN